MDFYLHFNIILFVSEIKPVKYGFSSPIIIFLFVMSFIMKELATYICKLVNWSGTGVWAL